MRLLKLFFLGSLLLLGSCSPSFADSIMGVTVVTSGGGATSTIQADNDDIRFASETTLLNHYIYERTLNGTATVWVKFPTLAPGNNTQYYFYYNNPDAIDTGSFSITFTKNYQETGLAGLWHFDEGSPSTTALDSSGNANTGTLVGLPTWLSTDGGHWDGQTATKFNTGSSLSFNGVNNYINAGAGSSLKVEGAPFSLALWLRTGSTIPNNSFIMSSSNVDGYGYFLVINRDANNIDLGKSGIVDQTVAYTFSPNTWYYIVAVQNFSAGLPSYVEYFINGSSIGTYVHTTAYYASTGKPQMIGYAYFGSYWNGIMDEVRVYNRALPLAELTALYERRKYFASTVTITYGTEETGSWALGGVTFSNRRPLTVNNSGATTLTDFQLKFQFKVGASGTFVMN